MDIDVDGPVAFVFLPPFASIDGAPERCQQQQGLDRPFETVQERYPGGEVREHVVDGCVFYQAYYLPR